ncbi:hypothetical protein Tco_1291370 [Tanacetum coccineum]
MPEETLTIVSFLARGAWFNRKDLFQTIDMMWNVMVIKAFDEQPGRRILQNLDLLLDEILLLHEGLVFEHFIILVTGSPYKSTETAIILGTVPPGGAGRFEVFRFDFGQYGIVETPQSIRSKLFPSGYRSRGIPNNVIKRMRVGHFGYVKKVEWIDQEQDGFAAMITNRSRRQQFRSGSETGLYMALLTEQVAHVQSSPGPAPKLLTPGPISSGLVPNPAPDLPYVPPTRKELEMLFQPMFDEYFNPPGNRQDPIPNVVQDPVITTGPLVSISIDLDAPSGYIITIGSSFLFGNLWLLLAGEQCCRSESVCAADPEHFTKDAGFNHALKKSMNLIDGVWVLVPPPRTCHDYCFKWIFYKGENLTSMDDVLKKTARLCANGFRQEEGQILKNLATVVVLKQSGYSLPMPPAKMTVLSNGRRIKLHLNGELKEDVYGSEHGMTLCQSFSGMDSPRVISFVRIVNQNSDTMADAEHAPTMAPPVRTDEQILPRIRWVPIGKSNCYLNEEKSQPSPIFKIAVDILKQTNFFRAFTASSIIPAIYIQQFWDTICFDSKAGSYKCQLDEQWFDLTQDTLRDALQITPVDKNWAFSPPPTPDTLIEFVNELGYPREVINLSNVTTNDMFQPWRALTTIINLCLTGKTSGFERPRAPVLQILWGVVNRAHIDYAERMWEEFTQSIHNFTEDKRNLAQQAQGKKKATIILIPSIRFTKLIIFHLQRLHNFHPRPESPLHLPTEEPHAKAIKQTKPKPTKQSKPTEPKAASKKPKPAPAKPQEKKRKPVSESSEAPPLAKRAKAGKVVKKRTVKSSKQLVPGKGKEKVGEEQAAQVLLHLQTTKKKSPTEQYIFQRHTPVPSEPAGHEESSSLYAELGLYGSDTESDEEMPSVVRSGAQDEGQAGPDPGKLDEGQAGPNPDDVAESQPLPTPSVLAGPNLEHSDVEITDPSSQPQPEHMDEGFTAAAYPDVQENLKLTVDEQVIPEEPVSSTGTLSSLQHLAKDFSFGDQFLNDKPSEADNEKTTADTEAESMVSVTIQQDTSVIPPMTSPVIGPVPRPDSPNVHWPLPTTTTTTAATTTTTLPLPPQP